MSVYLASFAQKKVYTPELVFQKEKSRESKSFCDQSLKVFRAGFVILTSVLAGVTAFVLQILAPIASLFGFKTLYNYLCAFKCKSIDLYNRIYSVTVQYPRVVNFAANRAPFNASLYKSGSNFEEVFKEIYKKDYQELMQRVSKVNDILAKDNTHAISTYKKEAKLEPYEHGGYCQAACLDFAARYLKEVKKGKDETQAIKKVSKVFENHVTSKAVVLQRINFIKTHSVENERTVEKLGFDVADFIDLKDAIKKAKASTIEAKKLEESADYFSKRAMDSASAIYNDSNFIPLAAVAGLKVPEKSKCFAFSQLSINPTPKKQQQLKEEKFDKFLGELNPGVYDLSDNNFENKNNNHSLLLIKKKSGDYCLYDSNFGTFEFKSKEAAKRLSIYFRSFNTVINPEKFHYLKLTRLELSSR